MAVEGVVGGWNEVEGVAGGWNEVEGVAGGWNEVEGVVLSDTIVLLISDRFAVSV